MKTQQEMSLFTGFKATQNTKTKYAYNIYLRRKEKAQHFDTF